MQWQRNQNIKALAPNVLTLKEVNYCNVTLSDRMLLGYGFRVSLRNMPM